MFVKDVIAMLQKKDPNENICAYIISRIDVADYSTCYDALKDKPLTGEELDEIIDDLDEVDLDMGLGWEAVSCCIEDIIEKRKEQDAR